MGAENIEIRNMTRQELDLALDWAAREGWNPGLADADAFWAADPEGFLVAIREGKPAGCVSVVRYSADLAFGGFFMVLPELRGLGIGRALAAAALEKAGSRIMGQDGVVAQQDNYKKMGFKRLFANHRYQGRGGGESPSGLTPLSKIPFRDVSAFDRECFGCGREAFLRAWLDQPGGAALGKLDRGLLQGFGVLRPCREGFKVGPLFANQANIAHEIFHGLAAAARDRPMFLDVPEPNQDAVALAQQHGMTPVFETARMYLNGKPELPLRKIFGITSFELG